MTAAERQRRHRGHSKLCRYCNQPGGQPINGVGYANEGQEPRQLHVCRKCLIEALSLYKRMAASVGTSHDAT
jgi:hypothetical protein